MLNMDYCVYYRAHSTSQALYRYCRSREMSCRRVTQLSVEFIRHLIHTWLVAMNIVSHQRSEHWVSGHFSHFSGNMMAVDSVHCNIYCKLAQHWSGWYVRVDGTSGGWIPHYPQSEWHWHCLYFTFHPCFDLMINNDGQFIYYIFFSCWIYWLFCSFWMKVLFHQRSVPEIDGKKDLP